MFNEDDEGKVDEIGNNLINCDCCEDVSGCGDKGEVGLEIYNVVEDGEDDVDNSLDDDCCCDDKDDDGIMDDSEERVIVGTVIDDEDDDANNGVGFMRI
ncbi:hypothetical protein INT45_012803 [Circinella minor]|uniref:Uncharacterized protein n=1 Tax=Circinella minor TaxID=1195481 RepID=A0A8H7RUK7_9FUNG|nr:hypothetical protein INT45_012803 [Circinella minor]